MKIIEQYLYEVGKRLPTKNRQEITNELRSLLLDELEEKHGPEADEAAAKQVLQEFGAPGEVARRYSGRSAAIAPGLTDLYFLILKIMLGAMAIAFTTVFLVELATGGVEEAAILGRALRLPLQILNGFFAGAGAVSLIFIGITRLGWNEGMSLEADWTPEELKDVELEPETESTFGRIFAIGGSMLAIALLNVYPQIMSLAEQAFLRSGLSLGHRLNIDLFRNYVFVFTGILVLEIVYHGIGLRTGGREIWLRLTRTGLTLVSIVFTALLVGDMRLYTGYESILGFRLIFAIALGGNIIELITELVAYGKAKIRREALGPRS